MGQCYHTPSAAAIANLLRHIHSIAVVGLSPRQNRPSYRVASAMQGYGYDIIPIRPAVSQILGKQAYATLSEVRQSIDLVNVFRAPQHVDGIVDTCIEMGHSTLWLQDGVINEPAAVRAQQAGLFVVMDRCIYRDYQALLVTGSAGR